jgi:hypothetical protein
VPRPLPVFEENRPDVAGARETYVDLALLDQDDATPFAPVPHIVYPRGGGKRVQGGCRIRGPDDDHQCVDERLEAPRTAGKDGILDLRAVHSDEPDDAGEDVARASEGIGLISLRRMSGSVGTLTRAEYLT